MNPRYNKSKITKSKLVKLANARFRIFKQMSGVYVEPCLGNENERHAMMTGKLRRQIVPFIWISLLGLQPDCKPDDDELLQASLYLNEISRHFRGINMAGSSQIRTMEESGKSPSHMF